MLTNLISNALKFKADERPIQITIKGKQENDLIVLSIKDNGVGFNMKYKNKLFGVFQRLHSDAEFEGTGVGLAIVQRIISKHGGTIWAESKVNEGTKFSFKLGDN